MDYDVVVIGGGPAGCKTAELIAKEGCQVLLVEEHARFGEPVQCAGLVSPRTLTASGATADLVINEIRGAYIHAPGGETLTVRGRTNYALVIDRAGFDRRLAGLAQSAGAEVMTGTRASLEAFLPERVKISLKLRNRAARASARLLVGADGPNSRVRRKIGSAGPGERVRIIAAEVELTCPETDMVHIFLGNEKAPGWFGWIIPVDRRHARVGLGVGGKVREPLSYFKKITEGCPHFKGMKVRMFTGGIVPIGPSPRIYGERVLLVGDAACQTKPVSGGGLYLGMLGAGLCARVAVIALASGNLSARSLSVYQDLWEKEVGGEILTALRHRRVFLSMKDVEMDCLIRFFKRPLWRHIIARYGDIDHISRLAGRLSFAQPWAERFILSGMKTISQFTSRPEYEDTGMMHV